MPALTAGPFTTLEHRLRAAFDQDPDLAALFGVAGPTHLLAIILGELTALRRTLPHTEHRIMDALDRIAADEQRIAADFDALNTERAQLRAQVTELQSELDTAKQELQSAGADAAVEALNGVADKLDAFVATLEPSSPSAPASAAPSDPAPDTNTAQDDGATLTTA